MESTPTASAGCSRADRSSTAHSTRESGPGSGRDITSPPRLHATPALARHPPQRGAAAARAAHRSGCAERPTARTKFSQRSIRVRALRSVQRRSCSTPIVDTFPGEAPGRHAASDRNRRPTAALRCRIYARVLSTPRRADAQRLLDGVADEAPGTVFVLTEGNQFSQNPVAGE